MTLCPSAFFGPVLYLVEGSWWRAIFGYSRPLPSPTRRRKSLAARPLQLPGSVNLLNAVEGRTSDALGTPLSLLHCGNLRCVSLARRSEICYSRSAAGKMHVEKVNTREGSAASPASARKVGQRLSRAARARPDEPGWPSPAYSSKPLSSLAWVTARDSWLVSALPVLCQRLFNIELQ